MSSEAASGAAATGAAAIGAAASGAAATGAAASGNERGAVIGIVGAETTAGAATCGKYGRSRRNLYGGRCCFVNAHGASTTDQSNRLAVSQCSSRSGTAASESAAYS